MKRIAVLGALAFLVLSFSAPRANAQLFCVSYLPDFCDRLEVEVVSGNVLAGNFDRACDNTFSQPMMGILGAGQANFAGGDIATGPPVQNMVDHNLSANTHDFWFWDGVILTLETFGAPAQLATGACPIISINEVAGVPRGIPD